MARSVPSPTAPKLRAGGSWLCLVLHTDFISWQTPDNEGGHGQSFGWRNMGNTTKPPANILELSLGERAEMALKAAFEKVTESHIRDGRPIYIWRDGKVVEMSAQELRDTPAKPQ